MNENVFDIESVRKKFEDIDSELNCFIDSIREIKKIRDSVESLPDRLKQSEEELQNRRADLDRMMSSTNNLLMTFEEQAKGIVFDLEKKTESLTSELKSSISQISGVFNENNIQMKGQYEKQTEDMSKQYEEIKQSVEILKNVVGEQQQTVNTLKSNYMAVSDIFSKIEPSVIEMKNNISKLQNRPHGSGKILNEMEERLEDLINENHAKQKILSWSLFVVLVTGFLYFLFAFYIH